MGLGLTIKNNEVEFSIVIRKDAKLFAEELRQLANKLEKSAGDLEIRKVIIETDLHMPSYNNIIVTVPKKHGFDYYTYD